MLKLHPCRLALGMLLAVGSTAHAGDESAVENRATQLLKEITADPDSGIPLQVLRDAQGILIVPHIVENQLGVGMTRGRGVYLLRNEQGDWGKPLPVKIGGMSVGAEAGRRVTDLVVIFQTRKAAELNVAQGVTFEASFEVYGNLRGPHKFRKRKGLGPLLDNFAPLNQKDVLCFARKSGMIIGAKVQASQRSALSVVPHDSKAAPDAQTTVAAQPVKNSKPIAEMSTPETVRLLAELTALTAKPAVVAGGPVDSRLSQASATASAPTGRR